MDANDVGHQRDQQDQTHVHANSKVAIGWQTFVTPRIVNAKLPPQKLIERPT
jgi:hypothetical protein